MTCATERVLLVELEERGRRAHGGWARSRWAPLVIFGLGMGCVRVAGQLP